MYNNFYKMNEKIDKAPDQGSKMKSKVKLSVKLSGYKELKKYSSPTSDHHHHDFELSNV